MNYQLCDAAVGLANSVLRGLEIHLEYRVS